MEYYIYIVRDYSVNEGQGVASLSQIAKAACWPDAYKIMVTEGEKLRADGWIEGCKSRSEGFSDDVWMEPDHGQDWKDWHTIKIVASVDELTLTTE